LKVFQSAQKENKKVDTIGLTFGEEQRRTVLVHKLTQGSINLTEAQELRTLLEKERHESFVSLGTKQ
jgi:hypothetical protein